MKTPQNKRTRQIIASLALVAGAVGVGAGASYAASPSTEAPATTEAPAATEAPADGETAPADGETAPEESCTVSALPEGATPPEGAEILDSAELPEGAEEIGNSSFAVAIEDEDGTIVSLDDLDPAVKEEILNGIKAENDAFIAQLDSWGIDYELERDEALGIDVPQVSDEAVAAAGPEVLDEIAAEMCADGVSFGEGETETVVEVDPEYSAMFEGLDPAEKAGMIEEMKTENAEIIVALDEAGIAYELITDPVTGVEFPGIDAEDEEAAAKVFEQFCDDADADAGDEAPATGA